MDRPTETTTELPPARGLASDFGDVETLMNTREWMRKALYAAGATYGGGSGCGCGQADIDIELEGHRFNVSIRPLPSK